MLSVYFSGVTTVGKLAWLDTSGDGTVSADEFEAASHALLNTAVGAIGLDEAKMAAFVQRMQGAYFALLDSDEDRSLDAGERDWMVKMARPGAIEALSKLVDSAFDVLDADSSGALTPEEMNGGKVPLLQQIVEIAEITFDHPTVVFPTNSGTHLLRLHSKLQLTILPALDMDSDGTVSKDEAHSSVVHVADLLAHLHAKLPAESLWAQVATQLAASRDGAVRSEL